MLLDLNRLRGAAEHLDRRYEASAFALTDEEFRLTAPVTLRADVQKDGRKIRLTGRLETTMECTCGRCLEAYPVPVAADLDLLFLPASTAAAAIEREIPAEDLGASYYTDDVLDLGEMMREQFYLAVPMKPLCREDCRGLCAVCGINRNRETCTCQSAWVDPRLAVLQQFKEGR